MKRYFSELGGHSNKIANGNLFHANSRWHLIDIYSKRKSPVIYHRIGKINLNLAKWAVQLRPYTIYFDVRWRIVNSILKRKKRQSNEWIIVSLNLEREREKTEMKCSFVLLNWQRVQKLLTSIFMTHWKQ